MMGQTGGRDSNGQRFKPDLWPNLYTKAFQYLITLKLCAAGEYAAGEYQYTRRRRILKREAERCEGKKTKKRTDGRTISDEDSQGRKTQVKPGACYDTQPPSQRRIWQEVDWKLSPSLMSFGTKDVKRSNSPALNIKAYCDSSNRERNCKWLSTTNPLNRSPVEHVRWTKW